MTLEHLRAALTAALAAAVALAALAATSCARETVRRPDSFVAARALGDSTASPGRDPDRPVARSIDTQEVSATIGVRPVGPPPELAGPRPISAQPAAPTPSPPTTPVTQSPSPTPPPGESSPSPTPPPNGTGSPGVFAPPPPPPPR